MTDTQPVLNEPENKIDEPVPAIVDAPLEKVEKKMSAQMKHYFKNKENLTKYYASYYQKNAERIKAKRRERYASKKQEQKEKVNVGM